MNAPLTGDVSDTKTRIMGLDCVKGVAIVLMVYGHSTFVGTLSDVQHHINDYIYTFHMAIFLFISGYLFSPRPAPKVSLKKTFQNLFLPYAIFLTLYLLGLSIANAREFPTTGQIGRLTLFMWIDKIILHPIGPYWFLHTLVIYQSSLALSFWIGKKTNTWCLFSFLAITFILRDVVGMTLSYSNTGFLVLGYAMRLGDVQLCQSWRNLIPNVILIVLIYSFYPPKAIHASFFVQTCLVISLFFTMLTFFETPLLKNISTIMAFVGKNTLVILVLHVFFLNGFKFFAGAILSLESTGVLYSISVTLLAVALSIASARVFDALRISKYFFARNHVYQPMMTPSDA
ncbi:MAG TPA: acyltransferase [Thermoguttaceae bacterium]|nr:acyltransferase [Thermoguttaceae bacterium]